MVVFRQIIPKYANAKTQYLKEQIQSFVYDIESFGLKAIEAKNITGAELAAFRIFEQYKKLKDASITEISDEIVDSALDLALLSSGQSKPDLSDSMLNEELHEWILKELIKNNEQTTIISKMRMKFPKYTSKDFDFDAYHSFTRRIGVRVGSNFGYNFDFVTGEDYSADDPRRR